MTRSNLIRHLAVPGAVGGLLLTRAVQAAVVVLETDLESGFLSERVDLSVGGTRFRGTFGFETLEVPAPNTILDALTFSLVDPVGGGVAILGTIDAAGLLLAPESPGALTLDPLSIQYSVASAPVPSELGGWVAFTLTFDLPAELADRPLEFYLDLASNLDGVPSRGFASGVAVPEPGGALMGGATLLATWAGWWRCRRRQG